MKKIVLSIIGLFLVASCSNEDYDNLNRDPNNPTIVTSEALFTSATKSLFDQMTSTNVNTNIFRLFSQYWTETQYIDESNYDLGTRNINGNHWSEMYRDVLYDLKDAKGKVDGEGLDAGTAANRKAMITCLEVYTWQQLVDTYGNIPYTQALLGTENPSPAYDDAATIYQDLFTRIDAAISSFNTSSGGFGTADVVYNNDIAKWKKFANSIKLRLAIRVIDVASFNSGAKIQEALTSGVFTSNSDNYKVNYAAATPNPVWVDLVQSNRNDFVPANTVVDYMNTLQDPRRPIYFDQNLGAGVYTGGVYGDSNTWSLYTHVGTALIQPAFRGVLLDYSEIQFYLAHAKAKGVTLPNTVDQYYNAGITASMQDWGVSASDITTYLASTNVAYATAAGTWQQKIGKQFWIAMYNRGFEGWTAWRQLDAPALNVAAESGDTCPTRFTYPFSESTYNGTNRNSAATAIGGDDLYTKLFWDVN